MPPTKKISTSKAKLSKDQPNPELSQKMKSKKAELKKKEQTEALAHTTQARTAMSPTPSEELARKANSKKTEHKKQELMEALTYPTQNAHKAPSSPLENHDKKYFQDLGARIAQRAFELHERRCKVHGHDLEDWLEAERQIFSEDNS